jgi:hypothetical protein
LAAIGRYLRTARHLTPGQIGWRLLHEGRLRAYRRAPGLLAPLWPERPAARLGIRPLPPPPGHLLSAEEAVSTRWRAGEVEYLGTVGSSRDWRAEGKPRLWRYERHYHAELLSLAAMGASRPSEGWVPLALELVSEWARACPLPRGDAWEPYPVARRLLSWSVAAALVPELGARLAPLVDVHLRFLRRHLERHLLGNHLLTDAAALVAGSAVVEAPGAESLGRFGERLLAAELRRQVLRDGGYAERTAQYHAIVLRDALVACALWQRRGRAVDGAIADAVRGMLGWLAAVRRDGALPWLNDAAPGATPGVEEVLALGGALSLHAGPATGWLAECFLDGEQVTGRAEPGGDVDLPDTGWSIVREGRHELLFEHGPIGPDEQPGHGHSDALSFELVWDGTPIVTDTGATTYEQGAVRAFERSAAGHASVTVGGDGPDELWAAFRVGARGRVEGSRIHLDGAGWRRMSGVVTAPSGWRHERSLVFWPGRALVVVDQVAGADPVRVESHLPLAPGVEVRGDRLHSSGLELVVRTLRGTSLDPRPGWVGRGFGRREGRPALVFAADGDGRVAYALARPDVGVSLRERTCAIHHGGADIIIPLDEVRAG